MHTYTMCVIIRKKSYTFMPYMWICDLCENVLFLFFLVHVSLSLSLSLIYIYALFYDNIWEDMHTYIMYGMSRWCVWEKEELCIIYVDLLWECLFSFCFFLFMSLSLSLSLIYIYALFYDNMWEDMHTYHVWHRICVTERRAK